jgi:hypothetical protein
MQKNELLCKLVENDYTGLSAKVKPNVKKVAATLSKGVVKLRKVDGKVLVMNEADDLVFSTSDLEFIAYIIESVK